MSALKDIVATYQKLNQEWSRKPQNLEKCGELLKKLKVALTELAFLPVDKKANKQELLVTRDILEIGAQFAVATQDIAAFERYMAQLKNYYFDYQNDLPESPYKFQLLGLNLLSLLAQNRLAEFHTELELLPVKEIQTNIYIRHPVSLEQYLMEGSYNKIFLARGNVPAASYSFFMDMLLNTIRDEIAACMEKAYARMDQRETRRMLYFDTDEQIRQYADKRKWRPSKDGFIHFAVKEDSSHPEVIPSDQLASQLLEYARQLEMIV